MIAKGRYSRNIDTEINIKNLYNYYKNICPGFYFSLKNKLKKISYIDQVLIIIGVKKNF